MENVILEKGWGYSDLTSFSIGNDFHRAIEDMHLTVIEDIENFRGYTAICKTTEGKKIAINKRITKEYR